MRSYWVWLCAMLLSACHQEKDPPKTTEHKAKSPLDFLTKARMNFPEHFSVDHLRELVQEDNLKEASRYINLALQASPQNPCLHLVNGFIYDEMTKKGDSSYKELAGVAYRRAHELDPSQWISAYLLGLNNLKDNKYEEAQQQLANALILRPNDPDILYSLAYASYYLKDIPVALSSIRKALSLAPTNPAIVRASILIFSAAADFKKARHYLGQYEKIIGSHEDVKVVEQRLEDWQQAHTQGKIHQVGDDDSAGEGMRGKGDAGQLAAFQQKQAASRSSTYDTEVIYIDCYMLRSSESTGTSQGNNILASLAVTLGSSLSDQASISRNLQRSTLSGLPVSNPVTGTWTKTFAYTITPVAMQYSLNIANVSDQIIEVIARPSVATLVGKPAYFLQGDQYTGAAAGQSGSAIATVDAGTKIEVTPLEITPRGLVVLEVTLTGSLFTTPPNTGKSIASQLIAFTRSKVVTTVKAFLGQTVMLGGIYSREQTSTKSGVPLLQDIPIVQYFFGNNTTSSDSRAVIYLLTPRKGGALRDYSYAQNEPPVSQRLQERGLMAIGEYPTLYYVIRYINKSVMFANFRSGDLPKPFWGYDATSLDKKLEQLRSFLWF